MYGNLTITTPGVKLKDTIVTGNLYLTGGVGLGNVELENVEVLGKIVICGGGEAEGGKHSVVLRNVTAGGLELDSISGQFLSLEAEGLTNIDEVTIAPPPTLRTGPRTAWASRPSGWTASRVPSSSWQATSSGW